MIVVIILGLFIALWFYTISLEIRARSLEIRVAEKGAIDKYHQLRKDIEPTPQYKKWRQSVFEKCGRRCALCDSNENLQIHHLISFYSIIRQNNITSIEQASECLQLWNINNGKVLCKDCHKKMESSRNRQVMMLKNN